MPIRLTDTLAYPNRGTVTHAFAYGLSKGAKRQDFLMRYLSELYRLCAKYNLDFSILVAQSANETDAWRSQIWLLYGSPAGIGVTGTDTTSGTNYSLIYKKGEDAARAHVVHMFAYVRGAITSATGELNDYVKLDPRYSAVMTGKDLIHKRPLAGSVVTIESLNTNGRWAELYKPPPYGVRIVDAGMDVWGNDIPDQGDPPVTTPSTPEIPVEGEPVAITFGRVPHPTYQRRIIQNSTAWNDLGERTIRAVVWHRMYGTLWGTDTYFRNEAAGKALTDYGVGVSATDGESQAGVILMWNDPTGRRAPWASGPVNNPIGDGAAFVQRYGVNGVNRDAVSIEISGTSGSTPFDSRARQAVVYLTAYYADQYKVPWDSFPAVPGEYRSFVMWHGEIYDGKRNSCPGAVIQADTNNMIELVQMVLKQYQTVDTTDPVPTDPVYAKPVPPAEGDSIVNDRPFVAHAAEYTTKKTVTPRIYADPGSDPTGPDIPKGTKVKTSHLVRDMGESADLTAVLVDGSRIPVKGVLV